LRWNESDTKVSHDLWAERCGSDGSRHARLMAARCAAAGLGFGSPSLHRLVGGGGFGLAGRAVLRRTAESARHAEARCVWRERGHVGPWVHGRARGWGRVVRVGPRACIDHRREAGPIAEAGLSESMFMPGPVPGGLESSGGVWDVRVITRSEVLAGGLVGPVLGDWAVPVGIRDEPGMTVGGGPRAPCSRGTSSKATQAYRQGGYSIYTDMMRYLYKSRISMS